MPATSSCRRYILPALQAGAVYEDRYPLATALGRPLIARAAGRHRADGRGDRDRARLHQHPQRSGPPRVVYPRARSVARRSSPPAQAWDMTHAEKLEYARARHSGGSRRRRSVYSIDTNLWGRAIASGGLEDAWVEPPEEIYTLTRSPQDSPDSPAYVELDFEAGVPVRANGVRHVAPRADREPRDHRRRPRRRPDRRRREPARRHQGARGLRGAVGGRAPHRAQGAREARDSARSRAGQTRPEPHLRGSRLQRRLVLAHPRDHRRVRRRGPAARHRLGAAEAVQGRLPHRRPEVAALASVSSDALAAADPQAV